jgi:dienelactone hydrolase
MTHRKMLVALLLCAQSLLAGVVSSPLTYRDGATELTGELFRDDAAVATRGGILVFHQWTGISEHEREVARKLAGQGFVVLCADVYGTGIRPQSPADCMAEVAKYKQDRRLTRARTAAALATLRAQAGVGGERPVVAIGYCFGGLCALEMARAGGDIRAAVSFHGGARRRRARGADPDPAEAARSPRRGRSVCPTG